MSNPIKHSGADWLQNSAKKTLSPFGIKVADVLGQVELGIYHMDEVSYSRVKIHWDSEDVIEVPMSSNLATFDSPKLTLLVFCCIQVGIRVQISGFSRHSVRLTFLNQFPGSFYS